MSLPIYQRVAVTDAGDVIPGAEYTVVNENTGVAAPIYSDRTGATLLTAPYFADSVGTIQFFIAQGTTFRVAASGGVGTYTDRYVYGVAEAVLVQANGDVEVLSGSLLVGTTTSRPAEFSHPDGFAVRADVKGQIQNTVTSATTMITNRDGTDGTLIDFRKEGTTVGSISTGSGDLIIGTDDTGLRFFDYGNAVLPRTTSNGDRDAAIDLGAGSSRFKDLYLSGGVVFGTPSGAVTSNTLDDYEEGTFTPSLPNGATYTVQLGKYTKIGDLVHIEIILGWSSNGYDNDFKINGLPFTPNGIPTFAIFNNGKTGIGSNKWNPESSGGTIYLRQSDATTGNSSVVSLATNDATSAFRITGSYKTNQ